MNSRFALCTTALFLVSTPLDLFGNSPETRTWNPPLGIPAPAFGITQSRPASPSPWSGTVAGFYYVDNSHPSSTDSSNPNGYPSRPRKTIPYSPPLPAGSVVEVRGGPYNYGSGDFIRIVAQGTASNPVFVSGVGMPRFDKRIAVYSETQASSYLIIEGLDVYACEMIAPAHHVALRECDVSGDPVDGGVTIASYASGATLSDIVVAGNVIHDNGDWQSSADQDVHGVTVNEQVSHCWIVDNEFYHNSGDGVQINAGQANQATTHHIYVGRNVAWENKQTGFWTKQAVDVIFSENTASGHYPVGPSPSAWGAGMGYQYGPERVWFLFNHIYDCAFGIQAVNTSGLGTGQNSYFIGNVIHDIHHDPGYAYTPGSAWSNAALMLLGTPNRWIVNNTIYNVDAGINGPSSGAYYMANNLIASVTEPAGHHIFLESSSAAQSSVVLNGLFDPQCRIRWGSSTVYSLSAFQTAFPTRTSACLAVNPQFVDPAAEDLHLQEGSPGVDHGLVPTVYALFQTLYGLDILRDADGILRPQGLAFDVGAYEGTPAGAGDIDGDGDVDLGDWWILAICESGPGTAIDAGCTAADFDADGDVDLLDFAYFQPAIAQ